MTTPIGSVLQGFARTISDLSRGASVEDIVATAAIILAPAKWSLKCRLLVASALPSSI